MPSPALEPTRRADQSVSSSTSRPVMRGPTRGEL
jgi:hypothetical protein